ncbi:MAG TPA: Holliday junction resolvase RuvX [bacterium]|nr:Holliday junction resolvase RuvX [bacterium]
MRALGIEVGTVRIGLALSDPLGYTAQPLEVVKRTNPARDLEAVRRIVEEKQVEVLVVGLPLNMNGTEGPAAEMARTFAALLAPLKLPVEFVDERTSSLMADAVLVQADVSRARRKQVRDKMAAALLLQTWLDGRRQGRLT